MIVYPSIDLIDGRCVRLEKGDFRKASFYDTDPVELARRYDDLGYRGLHVVDLDGSREGRPQVLGVVEAISRETRLEIQFGGGIRKEDDVRDLLGGGASRVVVGTLAAEDPDTVCGLIETHGAERIVLAADVHNDRIRVDAWRRESQWTLSEFLAVYQSHGIRRVLCTDVSRDGRMEGPATELYRRMKRDWPGLHLIASGGVRDMADIDALAAHRIESAVVGKALFEGTIDAAALAGAYGGY